MMNQQHLQHLMLHSSLRHRVKIPSHVTPYFIYHNNLTTPDLKSKQHLTVITITYTLFLLNRDINKTQLQYHPHFIHTTVQNILIPRVPDKVITQTAPKIDLSEITSPTRCILPKPINFSGKLEKKPMDAIIATH